MKKTIYIPKGQSCEYDTLVCERLVVNGHLKVNGCISARQIQGTGTISADVIKADSLVCDNLTAGTAIADDIMAKRISAVEIHAVSSLSASSYIEAGYVKTAKATIAEAEIEDMHANEIIKLPPKHRSLWAMLIDSQFRALLVNLLFYLKTAFEGVAEKNAATQSDMPEDETAASQTNEYNKLFRDPDFLRFYEMYKAGKDGDGTNEPEPSAERTHQFKVVTRGIDVDVA